MSFKVVEVIDGDTVRVSPGWKWDDKEGDIVRAKGYDTPEQGQPGFEEAKTKLANFVFDKDVELKNPTKITYGRLLCDIYLGNNNVADLFPEYQ